MILSKEEALSIVDKALTATEEHDIFVSLNGSESALTRFAVNQITHNVAENDVSLSVTAFIGNKEGTARTNKIDEGSIRKTVRKAAEIAALSPENPEHMPLLGPQEYLNIDGYKESTATVTPSLRAEKVKEVVDMSIAANLISAGTMSNSISFTCFGNNAGLRAYRKYTSAGYSTTVRTPDGTGSSKVSISGVRDINSINTHEYGKSVVEKAQRSANPIEFEPGDYDVILEPNATMSLLGWFIYNLNARAADEGRSFFSGEEKDTNKLGQKILGDNINISSDPTHPLILASPFSDDGLPARPISWVENGVLKNLFYDRYWAEKKGVQPTGFPSGVIMEGGDKDSIEELVADTKRALYVTTFWYIRSVDPMKIIVTGLTRDGLFLIEDGSFSQSLVNFRFNESPIHMLNNVSDMTKPLLASAFGSTALVPAIKVKDFTFTSVSPAV